MLISHELQIIFAHVAKTGGSSITAALRPWLEPRGPVKEVGAHGWQSAWHGTTPMHSPYRAHAGLIAPLLAKGYRMVASVRNPFTRAASFWRIKGRDTNPYGFLAKQAPKHTRFTVREAAGEQVDFVLKFETLADDWDRFRKCVGVAGDPRAGALPHENRQPAPMTHELLDECFAEQQTVDWVRAQFRTDFEDWLYPMTGALEGWIPPCER